MTVASTAFVVALLLAVLAPSPSAAPSPAELQFFEQKIRPALIEHCYECHGEAKQKGGLRLDSRAGWQRGGDSGAVIVAGKPQASRLIIALQHTGAESKMPRNAPKLDEPVIADFVTWVKMGAPDPREQPLARAGAKGRPWSEVRDERKQWWCFQPVSNPPPPAVKNAAWSAHPVDQFILAKLEARGLQLASSADPRTLIRRLTFALTGLPPTPEEVETFSHAFSPSPSLPFSPARENAGEKMGKGERERNAVEHAADRLLASPAFGERWARHWMDLARYAETFGSEHDYLNPHAWRYRDYLIRAFNSDLPYDRFVQEQVAGDLLAPRWNKELGVNESLLATAWHRMIESYATPVDVKREEISVIDWQIEALGKTFLGLTITCARCHDHKFDPVSDEDFYALYGVFASTRPVMTILDDPKRLTARDAELRRLKDKLRPALATAWRDNLTTAAIETALRGTNLSVLKPLAELAPAPDFAGAWSSLSDRNHNDEKPDSRFRVFADFSRGDLAGWRVSRPGLPSKALPAGTLSIDGNRVSVRTIQPAGYYSDAISERHGGSLRSPEFIITNNAVSVLASGTGKARLRLVIENFQNDLLLFKGINPDLDSAAPRWFTLKIKEQWLGRRARIELMTRDDKTCVGHKMDQVKWEKTDGRSSFGIQRVVFHDGNPPPSPSPLPAALWKAQPQSWTELCEQFARLGQASLKAWSQGRASDEDARWLTVLLEAGVLTNKPPNAPAVRALLTKFCEIEAAIPLPTRAPGVVEDGHSYDSEFFPRGDHLKPEAAVPRRFLEVLGGAPLGKTNSGRLALSRELTRRDNPLTARVLVNRVWQHLFGRGLVATPDNFGRMGVLPTHPELLDHLATKFMADGWSVKKLIRYLVTSRTWQLAAEPPARADEIDPNNELLSHARVRRIEAEAIRDAMLAVAGNLKSGHTGPGVPVFYRTAIDLDKQPAPGPVDGDGRRSVYLEARRLFPSEWLAAFDAPKPNLLTARRTEMNVPAQSLGLMNDPFVLHQAALFGKRIAALPGLADAARVERMYQLAFARPPTAAERDRAIQFVREGTDDPWRELAHALFEMKEFIYLR